MSLFGWGLFTIESLGVCQHPWQNHGKIMKLPPARKNRSAALNIEFTVGTITGKSQILTLSLSRRSLEDLHYHFMREIEHSLFTGLSRRKVFEIPSCFARNDNICPSPHRNDHRPVRGGSGLNHYSTCFS